MMKQFFLIFTAGLFFLNIAVAGVTVKTISGNVYTGAEVTSVDIDSINLSHARGTIRIPLSELSRETRNSLNLKLTPALAEGDFLIRVAGAGKVLDEFDDAYESHLTKLKKESQAQGRLDDVLAIRKELSEFRSGVDPGNIAFVKLKDLRAIYDKERMKRRNKVIDSMTVSLKLFQADLKELQKELTMANKLDEAIAVKNDEDKIIAMLTNPWAALQTLGITSIGTSAPEMETKVAPKGDNTSSTGGYSFENSLGMRFVPIPITGGLSDGQQILFSIWETRVGDYERFIRKDRKRRWPKPMYPQKSNHPAGHVSWDDAIAFCIWLTDKEHKSQKLNEAKIYRLPSDHEWSCAVGIGKMEQAEASIISKNRKLDNEFPWGHEFPPPSDSGNYNGEESKGEGSLPLAPIDGYSDGFTFTSPVGSYGANQFGLYDLGGNVWEWCLDWFNPDQKKNHVFRGAAFNWADESALLSSNRGFSLPEKQIHLVGFRVVIAPLMK